MASKSSSSEDAYNFEYLAKTFVLNSLTLESFVHWLCLYWCCYVVVAKQKSTGEVGIHVLADFCHAMVCFVTFNTTLHEFLPVAKRGDLATKHEVLLQIHLPYHIVCVASYPFLLRGKNWGFLTSYYAISTVFTIGSTMGLLVCVRDLSLDMKQFILQQLLIDVHSWTVLVIWGTYTMTGSLPVFAYYCYSGIEGILSGAVMRYRLLKPLLQQPEGSNIKVWHQLASFLMLSQDTIFDDKNVYLSEGFMRAPLPEWNGSTPSAVVGLLAFMSFSNHLLSCCYTLYRCWLFIQIIMNKGMARGKICEQAGTMKRRRNPLRLFSRSSKKND